MARGAHGWPSLHICRAAGEANIDEVDRAHRGPYHELNISRYSRTRGEYCTYTWKVRNESFLSTTVLCERLKLQCLYSGPLRPNWLDRSFSSCIRQLADSSGGKSEDSWASGPGSSSLCGEVFVTSLFFLLKIEDLENSKSFRSKGWLFAPNNNCLVASYSLFSSKLFTSSR